jgi:hypothetical protein
MKFKQFAALPYRMRDDGRPKLTKKLACMEA